MPDLENLLTGVSVLSALAIISLIVFAESGLLIGLILPGDTLLLTAGFFAATGQLPLFWVLVVIFLGAVIGDNVGYYVGRKTGPRIFTKRDGILFRKEYVERAASFLQRHGSKTILIARFVPYARTLTPMVAGAANMHRFTFVTYNIVGALLWTVSFVMLGYWLGVEVAEQLERYLVPTLLLGVLVVFSPTIMYFVRNRGARTMLLKRLFGKRKR